VKKRLLFFLIVLLCHWPGLAFFVEGAQRLKGEASWLATSA